eukprot:857053-Rhodomonas_salina.1
MALDRCAGRHGAASFQRLHSANDSGTRRRVRDAELNSFVGRRRRGRMMVAVMMAVGVAEAEDMLEEEAGAEAGHDASGDLPGRVTERDGLGDEVDDDEGEEDAGSEGVEVDEDLGLAGGEYGEEKDNAA